MHNGLFFILMNLNELFIRLQPEESIVLKGFGTFMKLHGWEQPAGEIQMQKASEISDQKNDAWKIWRISAETLSCEVELKSVVDFSSYFEKFKSDLAFNDLANRDGFLISDPNISTKNIESNYYEVAYFELPIGGILRAKSIFKDLIMCLLNKGYSEV